MEGEKWNHSTPSNFAFRSNFFVRKQALKHDECQSQQSERGAAFYSEVTDASNCGGHAQDIN
jgi:hypothetical protein